VSLLLVFLFPEFLNVNAILAFGKENVETLVSVLDSVWSIFKGNLSLAFYSFTALVGILFGGGTAVLNFILNMVCYNAFSIACLTCYSTSMVTSFVPMMFLKYLCSLN
jgi:hypothetical protein